MGGIDNIIDAQSTPDKLTVELKNRELIDYAVLQSYGAYLILEAKGGYLIRLGNMSTIIRNEILHRSKSVAELNQRKKLRVRKRNKAEEA